MYIQGKHDHFPKHNKTDILLQHQLRRQTKLTSCSAILLLSNKYQYVTTLRR